MDRGAPSAYWKTPTSAFPLQLFKSGNTRPICCALLPAFLSALIGEFLSDCLTRTHFSRRLNMHVKLSLAHVRICENIAS
jgi:hypothetical protein